MLRDGVDQRAAALLHLGDRAKQRRLDVLRIVDRAFAVAAHRAGEPREVRLRAHQVHADMRLGLVGAAQLRHPDLVRPVVVVGAVVVHHDQHRDLVLRRDPQRAGVEHQVAVGLDVDHEALVVAVRQRHAERDADLGRGAELGAGMAVRLVEVPDLADLALEVVRGQHPVLVLDDVPDLMGETPERDRRGVPVLPRLLLPLRPDLVVAFADRGLAVRNLFLELGVVLDTILTRLDQRRDAQRRVTQRPHRAGLHPAVVHRPFADADLGKADLDESRSAPAAGIRGCAWRCSAR